MMTRKIYIFLQSMMQEMMDGDATISKLKDMDGMVLVMGKLTPPLKSLYQITQNGLEMIILCQKPKKN